MTTSPGGDPFEAGTCLGDDEPQVRADHVLRDLGVITGDYREISRLGTFTQFSSSRQICGAEARFDPFGELDCLIRGGQRYLADLVEIMTNKMRLLME